METLRTILFILLMVLFVLSLLLAAAGMIRPTWVWRWGKNPNRAKVFFAYGMASPMILVTLSYIFFSYLLPPSQQILPSGVATSGPAQAPLQKLTPETAIAFLTAQGTPLTLTTRDDGTRIWSGAHDNFFAEVTATGENVSQIRLIIASQTDGGFADPEVYRAASFIGWLTARPRPLAKATQDWITACGNGAIAPLLITDGPAAGGHFECAHRKNSLAIAVIYRPTAPEPVEQSAPTTPPAPLEPAGPILPTPPAPSGAVPQTQ